MVSSPRQPAMAAESINPKRRRAFVVRRVVVFFFELIVPSLRGLRRPGSLLKSCAQRLKIGQFSALEFLVFPETPTKIQNLGKIWSKSGIPEERVLDVEEGFVTIHSCVSEAHHLYGSALWCSCTTIRRSGRHLNHGLMPTVGNAITQQVMHRDARRCRRRIARSAPAPAGARRRERPTTSRQTACAGSPRRPARCPSCRS